MLRERLSAHGQQVALARQLGLREDVVSRWVNGRRKPDPAFRAILEDDMQIPWRSWDEPLEESRGAA